MPREGNEPTKEATTTVIAGVDTHADTHTLALDTNGRVISTETFETSPDGYERLIDALGKPSRCAGIGVESTNSFGTALARRLSAGGFPVYEVLRPKRGVRRKDGKSDPIDAIGAARGVLAGEATRLPKSSDGWVEALRHLNTERSQLVAAMTMLANSTGGLLITAPEPVRERYRGLRTETRMNHLASCRPSGGLVAHSVLTDPRVESADRGNTSRPAARHHTRLPVQAKKQTSSQMTPNDTCVNHASTYYSSTSYSNSVSHCFTMSFCMGISEL